MLRMVDVVLLLYLPQSFGTNCSVSAPTSKTILRLPRNDTKKNLSAQASGGRHYWRDMLRIGF